MNLIFKITAYLEALSFVLLLLVGVPLKYLYSNDSVVKLLGMPHGILFILYLILAFLIKEEKAWSRKQFLTISALSLVPFGPFFIKHQ